MATTNIETTSETKEIDKKDITIYSNKTFKFVFNNNDLLNKF